MNGMHIQAARPRLLNYAFKLLPYTGELLLSLFVHCNRILSVCQWRTSHEEIEDASSILLSLRCITVCVRIKNTKVEIFKHAGAIYPPIG